MGNAVWAVAELENGALKSISLQLASKAASLAQVMGGEATVVVFGKGASAAADILSTTGVHKVLVSDDSIYDSYLANPATDVLAGLLQQAQPAAVLMPATLLGRDVAARLATRLGLGLEYNISAVEAEGGNFVMTTSAFGGQMNITSTFTDDSTHIIVARQNAFPATKAATTATIEAVQAPAAPTNGVTVSGPFGTEYATEEGHLGSEDGHPQYIPPATRSNVEEASIIVSGGRGVGSPENFAKIDALAKAIGGTVGASRPVTDDGWLPHRHHIGQTGRTVKPEVYIAFGISGAVQHMAGMQTSKHIIAVNKDKDAPIFANCDLGVVGDLNVILPELTQLIDDYKKSHA